MLNLSLPFACVCSSRRLKSHRLGSGRLDETAALKQAERLRRAATHRFMRKKKKKWKAPRPCFSSRFLLFQSADTMVALCAWLMIRGSFSSSL